MWTWEARKGVATCHSRCPLLLGCWTDIFFCQEAVFGYRLTVLSKLILDRRLCFWSVFGASEEPRWAESTCGHLTWPAVTFGTRTPLLSFLSNTILLFEDRKGSWVTLVTDLQITFFSLYPHYQVTFLLFFLKTGTNYCCSGWPGTCWDQAVLKLRASPASASQVLVLH